MTDYTRKVGYQQLGVALILLGLTAAYWIDFRAPAVGLFHDDGIYLVTAKALAEGKGYRIISLPEEIAQTKYPPLYPMLLAGVWKLYPHFPQNIPLLKLVSTISGIVWLGLCFFYIKDKSGSSSTAWGIVLLTAAAPWTIFLTVIPLSEMTFAAFCAGALLMFHRMEQQEYFDRNKALLAGTLAAAATLTRTAGFPLILAGSAILLFQKKFKAAAIVLASAVVLVSPWIWWTYSHRSSTSSAYDYYSQANYQHWSLLQNFAWPQKELVIRRNLMSGFVAPAQLLGMDASHASGWIVPMCIVGVFVMIGYLRELKTKINSLNVFLLLYIGIVLLWVWVPTRFLFPTLPFLLFFGYSAFQSFLRALLLLKSESRAPGWICLVILVPIVAVSLSSELRLARRNGAAGSAFFHYHNWGSMMAMFGWLGQNTSPDSVVMSTVDPLIYLYSGRKAVLALEVNPVELGYAADKHYPIGTPSQIVNQILLNNVSYIVRTPNAGFYFGPYVGDYLDQFIDEVMSRAPGAVRLVEVGTDPQIRVYKLERNKLVSAFGNVR